VNTRPRAGRTSFDSNIYIVRSFTLLLSCVNGANSPHCAKCHAPNSIAEPGGGCPRSFLYKPDYSIPLWCKQQRSLSASTATVLTRILEPEITLAAPLSRPPVHTPSDLHTSVPTQDSWHLKGCGRASVPLCTQAKEWHLTSSEKRYSYHVSTYMSIASLSVCEKQTRSIEKNRIRPSACMSLG
jgi:hypothetical protein